jgi:hypothetical protein
MHPQYPSVSDPFSSLLKWVSGGGINSPRHPKNHWLKAVETRTIRWNYGHFSAPSVHLVPLHVPLNPANTNPLTHTPTISSLSRQFIRSWRVSRQNLTVSIFMSIEWTAAWTIGSSSATGRWLVMSLSWNIDSSNRPMVPNNGLSVHLMLLSSLIHLCRSSGATKIQTVGSSDALQVNSSLHAV